MNCLEFTKWLENRDIYDVSEADKALKHTTVCQDCNAMLNLDEQLDGLLFKAMKQTEMPVSLVSRVDLSLDRVTVKSSRKKYGWYGALSAVMAAMVVFVFGFFFRPTSGIPTMDDLGRYVIADHSHHGDEALVVDSPGELRTLGDIALSYDEIKAQLPDSYKFVGARICPLGQECQSVHIVYNDSGKRVSVYLVKIDDIAFSLSPGKHYTVSSEEQTVSFWKKGGYVFAKIG